MEDLRRIIARRKDREEEEDRISQLPDEVIHHILSFVDVDLAVQTSVLSKRWVNLWFTLTHLNFEKLARDTDVDYYLKFVTNLLLKRNQLSDTSTIRIDCRHNELISGMILDYAACHNVKHFNISSAHIGRKLSFPLLETLHLSACQPQPPLMKWSVPSLKSLHLGGVIFDRRRFHFEKFSNLDNLCLSTCFTFGMDKFVINSPSVTCLNISNISEMYSSRRNHFVINAPKISCFRLSARGVPVLSATNGFPCLKEADFDITIDKDSLENYTSEDIKEIVLKFISLFREFGGIKFLTLTFETVLVLSKILDHIRCQPSPFVKLKSLNLRGYVFGAKNPTKYTNNVINYLLSSSPDTKIFVQDSQRQFRSYNPSDDILVKGSRGFYVVQSKENMALRQPATSNIHVNGDVMNSVLGVIPPATVHSEVNDQTCSYSKDDSFSLWEGHLVYPEYVDLLTYIKKEHPETFEHFAPETDFINTLGLNTLCSSVRALSEVSGASFNTSTITRYRGVFTDLEKWGFNTTWLLNLLPRTDEIQ